MLITIVPDNTHRDIVSLLFGDQLHPDAAIDKPAALLAVHENSAVEYRHTVCIHNIAIQAIGAARADIALQNRQR
ncbi:hypothetical protein [Isoalcanivorax indicus]|uniref:hypothetical protein n=1 Tax=Isoalcanivorax indicus TaxID=2202653 RepID=UPI0013C49D9F|nr:hypothetical protein [Isoalcanivorax indicus]